MSWFATDPALELDAKIEEATSEAIPNGELDMAVAMEITDLIRSKKVPPKQAMRGLKKRLTKVYMNPNTLAATLRLADVCVKNGGAHFLAEINLKEFIDYLVEYIFKVHYDTKNYAVYSSEAKHARGIQILKLVKEWSLYFQGQVQGNYLEKAHASLASQGYEFPDVDTPLEGNALNFADSAAPPDWVDGRECMICYNPFLVMNRKHHCRACGGVFCQAHSGKNAPLVSLGILEPVRVCDDCFQIHKGSASHGTRAIQGQQGLAAPGSRALDTRADDDDDDDEQLKRAIELSLQETSVPASHDAFERPSSPPPGHVPLRQTAATNDDVDEDAEMKAALAASLAEYQQAQGAAPASSEAPPQAALQEPELDFYLNIMPFNANAYPAAPRGQSAEAVNPRRQLDSHAAAALQQQNSAQDQFQHPYPHQAPQPPLSHLHLPRAEDLSPQEEEDISLFVQLMGGIKSDPAKQAGILYDQNLGELHARVVRLKPKLNRALRSSIEKYDLFLEMHNKINSITRLYDQFLDHKLSQAYNKHTFSPDSTPQNNPSQYGPLFFVGRNNTLDPYSGYDGSQLASPQATGQHIPYQRTAPQSLSHQSSQDMRHQQTGPRDTSRQAAAENSMGGFPNMPHATGPLPGPERTAQYPPVNSTIGAEQPFHNMDGASENTAQPSLPECGQKPARRESRAPYPADLGAFELNDSSNENVEAQNGSATQQDHYYKDTGEPVFPQVPSSPPSDGLSDAESVASRYPPMEDRYNGSDEEVPDGAPREHASARFPLLNEFDLPELDRDSLTLKKLTTNESRKFKAEPEPLIEL